MRRWASYQGNRARRGGLVAFVKLFEFSESIPKTFRSTVDLFRRKCVLCINNSHGIMETDEDPLLAYTGSGKGHAVAKKAKTTHVVAPEEAERRARTKEARKEYGRGKSIPYKSAKDKKLRTNLKRIEEKYTDAAVRAKDAEILLEHDSGLLEVEHELERTYKEIGRAHV